jgi:hypothetical protein
VVGALLPDEALTVAVKVTDPPLGAGFAEEASAVVVAMPQASAMLS